MQILHVKEFDFDKIPYKMYLSMILIAMKVLHAFHILTDDL